MTGSTKTSIFFVGMSTQGQDDLDACLRQSGMSSEHFRAAGPCLESLGARPCHLLVVSLDGETAEGLQLLGDSEPMIARIPTLALVDHGDISTAVQAIRAGAVNCLEKPVEVRQLCAEIRDLLQKMQQDSHHSQRALTPMETTVLRSILEGKTNHETAQTLHRSPRTIEVHRAHLMRKLGVSSMVDLVRVAATMGLFEA